MKEPVWFRHPRPTTPRQHSSPWHASRRISARTSREIYALAGPANRYMRERMNMRALFNHVKNGTMPISYLIVGGMLLFILALLLIFYGEDIATFLKILLGINR